MDEIDRNVDRLIVVNSDDQSIEPYVFQHPGCNGGCRSKRFQCLMHVLYRLVKGIDEDHGQNYDELVVIQ